MKPLKFLTLPQVRGISIYFFLCMGLGLTKLNYAQTQQEKSTSETTEKTIPSPLLPHSDKNSEPADLNSHAEVLISANKTRSSVSLTSEKIQRQLPGINPLKAIHTLPGVNFQSADPWGNNEQNFSLFIHGFSAQQMGYTLDGVPLGDQQYGNYNGLSPQRAIISENVQRVILSSGAGDLATASTSNLGGTIETFSSEPHNQSGTSISQSLGSYSASRSFLRYDNGTQNNQSFYLSFLHQRAKAWDFDGKQSGTQLNGKYINELHNGKLSLYFNYSNKTEPNEDSVVHIAGESSAPITRPYLYPNFTQALAYLSPNGEPLATDGANYRNYFGVAQRTDYLGYVKLESDINNDTTWTNQVYFHYDDGYGAVAGPIAVAGLPSLFSAYFPQQNLKQLFGNSGYAVRTTEYGIKRGGLISTLRTNIEHHQIEIGAWIEQNNSSAFRRWYPLSVQQPLSPYERPSNPQITQYGSQIANHVLQFHVQDEWRPFNALTLQAGFKSSLQFAEGQFPIQPALGVIAGGSTALPVGKIITKKWFLPQLGMIWSTSSKDQIFINLQHNLRQFVTYGAVGPSPWSLSNQAAFDIFKNTAKPETASTFEIGMRTQRNIQTAIQWPLLKSLSAFEGQINFYQVNFSDRLLQISPSPVISSIVNGNPILANVGGVKTQGIDIVSTLHFGSSYSFYNALSFNHSTYTDNYQTGNQLIFTAGKMVPGSPTWLHKMVASAKWGDVEIQVIGDYVGKRYTTFTNDLSVPAYFITNLSLQFPLKTMQNKWLRNPKMSLNILNLYNRQGASKLEIGAASGTYNSFPIAPRQGFVTFSADF